MAASSNGAAKVSWNLFNNFFGYRAPERTSNGPTLDGPRRPMELNDTKRKRSPAVEIEEESPGKRRRRDSPPRASGMPPSAPLRRSGSVKALNLHDSNAHRRPISSLRSEASFASGTSTLSRGMSTGLSSEINRLKIQTASPTPAPEWSNLSAPKAGVSSHSYNISQRLGSVDMSLDSAASSSDSASRMSVQRGLTPTGATFGAMRTMLDSTAHSVRNASRSPVSTSKPIIDRHGSSGPWVSRSSSVKAPRFGDSSLSRGRTTSLASAVTSAYQSSNASADGEDRTTPTPNDGALSSPPVTSPSSSNVGSPPPPPSKPLSLQAQRAMDGLAKVETPLRHSFSTTARAPMRKVKVPMPSKKSTSYGRSSDAGSSRHSHSQSESGDPVSKPAKSEAQGHQRTASGPYSIGRDKASGKKILDKRRAEEKDLDGQRAATIPENIVMEDVDLHVEPIKKGKGDASPLDTVMQGDNVPSQSKLAPARNMANRLTPSIDSASNSGTSSRTVGKSQLRVGREKTNHQHSVSVTSASTASQAPPPSVSTGRASSLAPPEGRTRIPASEIPARFNPMNNDRLRRAMSTGRFSLPPDDDEEDTSMASASRGASVGVSQEKSQRPATGPALNITDNMKMNGYDREKTPERESPATPMNISPVKESFKRSDSDASDMMSTTPTESSIRNAFSMTPIVQEPQESKAPSLPTNPFARVETPATQTVQPMSFGFTPVPAPARPTQPSAGFTSAAESKPSPFSFGNTHAPVPTVESKPSAPSPFSFASSPSVVESKPVASPFSFAAPLPDEGKPPAPSPFSFGSAPAPVKVETPKPAMSGFSFLPAPGTTQPAASGSSSGFSFPSLTSTPAFPPASAEPAKNATPAAASPFSFGATPLPTLSISPPPEAPKEAPKPFSFGNIAPSAPAKAAPAPFSFGQPSATVTPKPSNTAPVSTTPATPSPVKPLFSFPGSTPAANISTTPQSSPFSFGSESPSPVKPLSLGAPLEIKTPVKDNAFSFGAPSTTPAATPIQQTGFSFGNVKSTTPAATPSSTPFSFGAPTASSNSAAPFTFGAPPAASTTPAVTPIQTTGFNFSTGNGASNQFTSQTTPTTNRGFNFGGDSAAAPSTTPSFSFGTPGDATPKGSHTPGGSFSFGAPAPANTGFSFGASTTTNAGSGAPGLVFPSGPTTPTAKLLELDSMDSSPIRGGGTGTSNGTSFSAANTGSGFSFGSGNASGGGFGANPTAPPLNTANSGFGAQTGSGFGSGFGREASPAPSPSTFSFGNNLGSGPGGFGQPPASTPFGQNAPSSFGQNNGFSFSQPNSATSASPFNQAQALPSPAGGFAQLSSPATGGFAQLSSPAASPFLTPVGLSSANPFGGPQGQKRAAEDQASDGLQAGGDRKIAPMPRSRKPKTEAERRAALQRAHKG